jgi:hypothetical protein
MSLLRLSRDVRLTSCAVHHSHLSMLVLRIYLHLALARNMHRAMGDSLVSRGAMLGTDSCCRK